MLNSIAAEHTKHNNEIKRPERTAILLGRKLEKASFREALLDSGCRRMNRNFLGERKGKLNKLEPPQ